jgi:hypothetical protein
MKSECDIVNYDPYNSAQREQIEKSHGPVSEVSNPQQKSATTLEVCCVLGTPQDKSKFVTSDTSTLHLSSTLASLFSHRGNLSQ